MKRSVVLVLLVLLGLTGIGYSQGEMQKQLEKAIANGRLSEIEPKIIKYAIADPRDAQRIFTLGLLRFHQSRFRESSSLFKRAIQLDKNLTSPQLMYVRSRFSEGRTEEAKSAFKTITLNEISKPADLLGYAVAAEMIGECETALNALDKLPRDLQDTVAIPLRLNCSPALKQSNDADLIRKAAQLKDWSLKRQVVQALFENRRYADTIKVIGRSYSKEREALEIITVAHLLNGQLEEAKPFATDLSTRFPESIELNLVNGVFALNMKKAKEAEQFLGQYLKSRPNSVVGLEQYVLSAISANQPGPGVEKARTLIKLRPDDPTALYLHGAVSLQGNRLSEAEKSLVKLMKQSPNHSQGCLALGLVYSADTSKFEQARAQMRDCIKKDPNSFEAYYRLGLSYKERGDNKEAIDLIKKTVELQPDYASAQRDLGALYLQIENNDQALYHLKLAVALNDKDSDTHFQLSRLYNLLGKKDLARTHFQEFRKLRQKPTSGM